MIFLLGVITLLVIYIIHLHLVNHKVHAEKLVLAANLLDTEAKLKDTQDTLQSLTHITHK